MGQDRCDIIGGPCIVRHTGIVYVSEGDVVVDHRPEYRDMTSALLGKLGQRKVDQAISIKFTPIGIPAYAPTLYPMNVGDIGSDICGCVDAPLSIEGADGTTVVYKAAGIKTPPPLRFAPNKSLYGEVEFVAVVANNGDLSTADAMKTITTGNAFVVPSEACDVAGIIERAAIASWGAVAPFDALEMTEDGAEVTVEYEIEAKKTASNGTIGYRLVGIVAKATLRLSNITEAQFFEMIPIDGPNALLGAEGVKKLLTLTSSPSAGGLTVLLPDAFPDDSGGSLVWGANQNRIGGVTLRSSVSCDASGSGAPVLVNPFSIAVNP